MRSPSSRFLRPTNKILLPTFSSNPPTLQSLLFYCSTNLLNYKSTIYCPSFNCFVLRRANCKLFDYSDPPKKSQESPNLNVRVLFARQRLHEHRHCGHGHKGHRARSAECSQWTESQQEYPHHPQCAKGESALSLIPKIRSLDIVLVD